MESCLLGHLHVVNSPILQISRELCGEPGDSYLSRRDKKGKGKINYQVRILILNGHMQIGLRGGHPLKIIVQSI